MELQFLSSYYFVVCLLADIKVIVRAMWSYASGREGFFYQFFIFLTSLVSSRTTQKRNGRENIRFEK